MSRLFSILKEGFVFSLEITSMQSSSIRIAELHGRMDGLADLIGENGTRMQYEEIANYFCSRSLMNQAAKFFKLKVIRNVQ
ncbi:WD repeat-containing protein 19 [Tritrichomonas musculus]|uniref:WD repeat-containing protein 19 n=1 Tax=Tritrichomonas musculus TaxID=1915356 RepID=A0ABR2K478_9EUKA